jgi:STE24 endopeptidase
MLPLVLLGLFVVLRLGQQAAETALSLLNRRHVTDAVRLAEAARELGMGRDETAKAVAYFEDRLRLGLVSGWTEVVVGLVFLVAGGLHVVEAGASVLAGAVGEGAVAVGLAFFAILAFASALLELPFDLYSTFHVEQKHGFNRQTLRGFLVDRVKATGLAVALGGPTLAAILWIMNRMGPSWWLWAWAATTVFSLLVAWIYPTLLAPLFNRFTPLPEGDLRQAIVDLARRTGFRAGGIFVMDASRRTSHGNAYFTGLMGQKRIVLFDTLVDSMGTREVVAVLAHELGHFKLHHVRWTLVRGVATSGLVFLALSLCLPLEPFYAAFRLERTAYGGLVVFGLWFSLVSFLFQPLQNSLSRRYEFAADDFALKHGASARELGDALRALREKSRLLPLAHPLYSRVYYSHPPLLERLRAMRATAGAREAGAAAGS